MYNSVHHASIVNSFFFRLMCSIRKTLKSKEKIILLLNEGQNAINTYGLCRFVHLLFTKKNYFGQQTIFNEREK